MKRNEKQTEKEQAEKEQTERAADKRKYHKAGNLLWAFMKLRRLDGRFLIFIFAHAPVAVAIPLVGSLFSKVLIDRIGEGVPFRSLVETVIFFLMVTAFLTLLERLIKSKCDARQYYPTMVYQSEMSALENYETDYENLERQHFREVNGYAWQDACQGNCSLEFFWRDIDTFLEAGLGIITYASILVVMDPIIFVSVAILSVLSYFTTRWEDRYREKNKHRWEKDVRKKDYLEGLSDDFPRAKDIKLYGLEPWLDRLMRSYQGSLLMWEQRCSLRGLWASVLAGLMALFQNGIAYVILTGALFAGRMTVGGFVFYFGLVGGVAGFLQGIIRAVAKLNTRAEKITRYRELYDYPNRFNHGKGCSLPEGPVKIELKDVWYRYDGAKDYCLKGINLCIEGGQSLALVGVNGAGKTTLIKLICGMYAPSKGEILAGGKRIDEYNIEEYYSLISAVFQEIRAVAFTCFEFVAGVDPKRSTAREDAVAAMKAAGIYEKVSGLPRGIDTHLMRGIYDDGVDLSGGEMQKLVLARAIYKDGPILILDEPTAALDPIAENNLYRKYRQLTMGKTSVYISHRFASTRFCDRIVLLENGRILESGTHVELMEKNGRYAYMFKVQSKYYSSGSQEVSS